MVRCLTRGLLLDSYWGRYPGNVFCTDLDHSSSCAANDWGWKRHILHLVFLLRTHRFDYAHLIVIHLFLPESYGGVPVQMCSSSCPKPELQMCRVQKQLNAGKSSWRSWQRTYETVSSLAKHCYLMCVLNLRTFKSQPRAVVSIHWVKGLGKFLKGKMTYFPLAWERVCICRCIWVCMWKPEANVVFLPQTLSTCVWKQGPPLKRELTDWLDWFGQ